MIPFTECVVVGLMIGLPTKTEVHYVAVPYGNIAYVSLSTELAKIVSTPADDVSTVHYARGISRKVTCEQGHLFANWYGGEW